MRAFCRAVLAVTTLAFLSCQPVLNSTKDNMEKIKKKSPLSRSIDSSYYKDLTLTETDATTLKKPDVLYHSFGTYYQGESSITIDQATGSITLSGVNVALPGKQGTHSFKTKYVFDVYAASKHCLYIRQSNRADLIAYIDMDELQGNHVPDLLTCVPLYGYGASRIEVSPIMDGFIAMPSGTYWKK